MGIYIKIYKKTLINHPKIHHPVKKKKCQQ